MALPEGFILEEKESITPPKGFQISNDEPTMPAFEASPTTMEKMKTAFRSPPIRTLSNKFRSMPLFQESAAKCANLITISDMLEISISDARKNYDYITREWGGGQYPTLKELAGFASTMAVGAGLAYAPLATVKGILKFGAVCEAASYGISKFKDEKYQFLKWKTLSDLLPEETNQMTKDLVDVIDFIGKMYITRGLSKTMPKVNTILTKQTIKEFKLPQRVYISPDKVKNIFGTGKKISAQELDLWTSLNLKGSAIKQAIKNGIDIEVPSQRIVTITDKPYWAKIKGLFNIKPHFEQYVNQNGAIINTSALKLPVGRGEIQPELDAKMPKVALEALPGIPEAIPVIPIKPTPIVKAPVGKIVTDPVKVQEIKESIAEGNLTLRTGKFHGRKLSKDELWNVRKSVEKSMAKIGEGRIPAKGYIVEDVTPAGYEPAEVAPELELPEYPIPEEIKIRVEKRGRPQSIEEALEQGDWRSILSQSGIKYDEYVTKNFEPEELKKIQFLFTKGGKSADIAAADLMIDHPEVGEITGYDIISKAIEQTGKPIITMEVQELEYAKQLEEEYYANETDKQRAGRKIEEAKRIGREKGIQRAREDLLKGEGKPVTTMLKTLEGFTEEEIVKLTTGMGRNVEFALRGTTTEKGVTLKQLRYAHLIASRKGLISKNRKPKPGYRRLAKALTDKRSMKDMTSEEASIFIDSLDSLVGIPPKIPTSKNIITEYFAKKIPTLKEIGIKERFRPAYRVFKKIGLKKEVFEPAFKAELKSMEELLQFRKDATELQKLVGKEPEISMKIFDELENPKTQKLTDNERKVVQWGKKFFEDWADRLEIPQEKRRSFYVTHIFEAEIAKELKEKHPLPADLVSALDFITPKKIFNPYLQERLGKKTGLKRDFWSAIQAYENRALKQFYYQPIVSRIRVYEKYLPPNSARYLRGFVKRITGSPLIIDQEINQSLKEAAVHLEKLPGGAGIAELLTKGNAAGMMAYNFTGLLYESFMGGRPASAIKNLSQHGLTLSECGPVAFSKAISTGIGTKERAELLGLSEVLRSRVLGYLPGIDETFIKSLESKRRAATMFMFKQADRKNVSDAFLSGYYEATGKGLPKEWAIKRGDEVAIKTQYLYTKLAGAQWTQTAAGRIMGVFTTWPENWAELMNDWVQAKPSEVFTDYYKSIGQEMPKTNWVQRRKALWTYLALVLLAYQVEKRTPIRASMYTGWTSIRSLAQMAHGNFAGLDVIGNVAFIVAGLMTNDIKMIKQGWNRIRPDRFVIIVREIEDIIAGKKDWLNLFIYKNRKKEALVEY